MLQEVSEFPEKTWGLTPSLGMTIYDIIPSWPNFLRAQTLVTNPCSCATQLTA
jgi:hypothetical protein